jgi:hypothetical protein
VKNFDLSNRSKFVWLAIFAMAMGFLEGIVVIYLRELYYPQGFGFPLKLMSPELASIEWIREITTLIMLAAVGIIAGRNNLQRLLYFLFTFGVWDIFYYVALKLLIGWPASLLTWDLLFLIPVSWLSPVLAPVICSVTMIVMALMITGKQEKGFTIDPRPIDWILIAGGAAIILYTFMIDYMELVFDSGVLAPENSSDVSGQLLNKITNYLPGTYNWFLFIIGELMIIAATVKILIQAKKADQPEMMKEGGISNAPDGLH